MAASATLDRRRTPVPPAPNGAGRPAPPSDLDGDAANYTSVTRWIVLIAVMLGTLLEVLDTSIVNVAIPNMMGNLGATINEIGWVSTGYIVANVIVLPLTGWLSSYFGRRRYLTFSILLFTLASFLCGHSHTLGELVGFRIMQGAGGAALLSSAQATLMEVFPRKQLAMVQAIFTIGVVFAPTVGPTLGGWITDNLSWPWIFYVNIPIGILAAFMVWTFLKDSVFQSKPKGKIDIVGIGLLAVGLGSLQTVLEKGNEEGWLASNLIIVLSLTAAIALYSFIIWELNIEYPAVNLRVLKNSGFTAGAVMGVVLGFGLYGGVFILPIFLQQIRGFTPTEAGMVLFPGGCATVLILPIVGRLMAKVQPRILVLAGSLVSTASFWMLSYLTTDTSSAQVYIPLIVRGAGMGLLFLPLSLATLTALTPAEVPGGAGLYNLARQLGGSMGIAMLATYIDHHTTLIRGQLADNVTVYSNIAQQRLQQAQGYFMSKGYPAATAHDMAISSLDRAVSLQSSVLTFNGAFQIISACFLVGIPMFFVFKKSKIGGAGRPAADVH